MKDISIADLIHQQFPSPVKLRARAMESMYFVSHGDASNNKNDPQIGPYKPSIEAFNDKLNKGEPTAVELYRNAVKEGRQLRNKIAFSETR